MSDGAAQPPLLPDSKMSDGEGEAKALLTKKELIDKFGWEEYLIFSLMLAISAAIGIYFWWKSERTNHDFLLGKRKMGVLPMSMSLLAR